MTMLMLEGLSRYYFYLWNTNQTVPVVLFGKPYPKSENLKKVIIQSADPKILFELVKNSQYVIYGKPFVTNSEGVLGVTEYSFDKPANVIRIVGVGDSVMSSWG